MQEVIVVGGTATDFFVDTGIPEAVLKGMKSMCYDVGSKILVKKMTLSIGGGGFNTSTSFSKLGFKTAFLGRLAQGSEGDHILNALKKSKIEFLGKLVKGTGGYSVILDSIERHRTILLSKGINDDLDIKDFKPEKAKLFYFSSMIGKALNTQHKISEYAKKIGAKVAYNPAEYAIRKEKNKIKRLIKNVDILVLNKEEAIILLEGKTAKMEELVKRLANLGPEIVCVTDGANDAMAYDSLSGEIYSITPHKIKAKENTGAGDAFSSAFAAGLIKGNNLRFALEMGLTNSESVIMHLGTTNKLLNWEEINKYIKKRPHKIVKK